MQEVIIMFRIKSEGANTARTVRFTEKLFEEMNRIAAENGISFNALVLQCCRYALDHSEYNTDKTKLT